MWLLAVIPVLLILIALLALILFRRAFFRPASVDPEDEAALRASRWFAFGPILRPGARWLREQSWERESLRGTDGAELTAYRHAGRSDKPALLLFHDYGSGPWLDFCLTARWAIRQGWGVLLPIQRAHGESGGSWCTLGLREGEDCLLWVHRMTERLGADCRLVLGGTGLGAAAVLSALDRGAGENVRALLLDSAYFSPRKQMKYMLRERLHMRTFPLLQLLCLYARLCWGEAPGSLDGLEALRRNTRIPVFFAHGREDTATPYASAEEAYAACAAPKKLFTGENAGHGACAFTEGERYFTELETFLGERLGEGFPLRENTKKHTKRP